MFRNIAIHVIPAKPRRRSQASDSARITLSQSPRPHGNKSRWISCHDCHHRRLERKFNNLLVVVDTLIKQVHLIPTTKDVTAEGVAQLYFDNIYKLHGLPRAIISDRPTGTRNSLERSGEHCKRWLARI